MGLSEIDEIARLGWSPNLSFLLNPIKARTATMEVFLLFSIF